MPEWFWYLAFTAPACVPLVLTLVNLLSWTRGQPASTTSASVSVLIPARNEARNIAAAIRTALASRKAPDEVLVYDDESTDSTGEIVDAIAAVDSRVRRICGHPLPAGWVGKPHACHQLASAAGGEILVFLDADVRLHEQGLERLLSLLEPRRGAATTVVSAVPRQLTGGPFERLLMPLLTLTYTSWIPLVLVHASANARFVAANGQLMALRAADYRTLGGFAAVAHEIVDDVAFCRHAKHQGARVLFADGFSIARCRMYRGAKALWRGFSKNLYEGIGEAPLILGLVALLYLGCFVAPYLGLALGLTVLPALLWPSALGVAANVLLRLALVLRFRQPVEGLLLHPLAVVLLLALAVNSWRWSRRSELHWAGRTYPSRATRVSACAPADEVVG